MKKNEKMSEELKSKISKALLGRKISNEHRRKISKKLKGQKLSKETRHKMSLTRQNEDNPAWKGDKVGYIGIHAWIRRKLGKPLRCDLCGSTKKQRYEWSNIDKKYTRNFKTWQRLCVSCHRKKDSPKNKLIYVFTKKRE